MKNQTAVDWLFRKLWDEPQDKFTWYALLQEAKAMEKEQIESAFVECWKSNVPDGIECKLDAEQYYNETFAGKDII
jgi:uncharacterized protein YbaA (DUF1428 family)